MIRFAACLVAAGLLWAEEPRFEKTAQKNQLSFEYTPEAEKPTIRGFVAWPDGEGPFPAVVVNHGSNGTAQSSMQRFAKVFLDGGYAVLAADLAHARGGNRDPQETRRRLHACLAMLEKDTRVASGRIAMYGNSYGSFATLAMLSLSDKVKVAAFTGGGLPRREEDKVDLAAIAAPLLILHGADDSTVPLRSAQGLKDALDAAKKTVEMKVWEGVGHDLPEVRKDEVFREILRFFDAALATETGGIQWYATWAQAKAEAARLERPILLISAAPQCHGISGIW